MNRFVSLLRRIFLLSMITVYMIILLIFVSRCLSLILILLLKHHAIVTNPLRIMKLVLSLILIRLNLIRSIRSVFKCSKSIMKNPLKNSPFMDFLSSSMGRNIYHDIPTLDEYWDFICHLYNHQYYA